MVHEVIAVRLAAFAERPGQVADQANSHGAQAGLLLVGEGVVEEGAEVLHVLVDEGSEGSFGGLSELSKHAGRSG